MYINNRGCVCEISEISCIVYHSILNMIASRTEESTAGISPPQVAFDGKPTCPQGPGRPVDRDLQEQPPEDAKTRAEEARTDRW